MTRSALHLAGACCIFACSSVCLASQRLRSSIVPPAVDSPLVPCWSRSGAGASHSIGRSVDTRFPALAPLSMAAGKMQLRGGGAPGCEDKEEQEPLEAVLAEVRTRNAQSTSIGDRKL